MKLYPQTYEKVYLEDPETSTVKLKIDKISIDGMGLNEYRTLFKDFLNKAYSDEFANYVKLSWLRRKFCYYGKKTILPMNKNSRNLNSAFVKYLRRYIGKDIQIITRQRMFSKLEFYFDEFFPRFEEEDPFKNPDYYKFPFKNISLEYLMIVYQLEDRFELLKYADKMDMTYASFVAFMANHVNSVNEELDKNRYELVQTRNFPFYIRDLKKPLPKKKKNHGA